MPDQPADSSAKDPADVLPPPQPVDHSMKEEEPLGWDQAPVGEDQPHPHRHPRPDGKGGVPDEGDRRDIDRNARESTSDPAEHDAQHVDQE